MRRIKHILSIVYLLRNGNDKFEVTRMRRDKRIIDIASHTYIVIRNET